MAHPSLKGHFLLASHTLKDGNFVQSVILMIRHDLEGALGLIINSPIGVSVSDAIGETIESAQNVDEPLYRGGPCQGPLMVLHGSASVSADEVLPGIYVSAEKDPIDTLMQQKAWPIRYVVNFSAWAADQLEREMAEGSWLVLPASPQDVFSDDLELWRGLMTRANLLRFVKPAQIPDHGWEN